MPGKQGRQSWKGSPPDNLGEPTEMPAFPIMEESSDHLPCGNAGFPPSPILEASPPPTHRIDLVLLRQEVQSEDASEEDSAPTSPFSSSSGSGSEMPMYPPLALWQLQGHRQMPLSYHTTPSRTAKDCSSPSPAEDPADLPSPKRLKRRRH